MNLSHQNTKKKLRANDSKPIDNVIEIVHDGTNNDEQIIELPFMKKQSTMINKEENDMNENDHRYQTNIGLFGFGIDHQHHHLGPHQDNHCLKTELINTHHIKERSWKIGH